MDPGPLKKNYLQSHLYTSRIGREIEILAETSGTNRYVLDKFATGSIDGLVVLAEHQLAGAGRMGRTWHCPTGAGILCTVALCDYEKAINSALLSLVVPIAVYEGLRATTDVPCEIKWPNDLVVRSKKLGGILIESRVLSDGAVGYAIGFGINCLQHRNHFPPELREQATSLDIESRHPISRRIVLTAILSELDKRLKAPEDWRAEDICQQWKARAVGLGSRICLEHQSVEYSGHLVDIDPTAAILVQLDQGGRRLFEAFNTTIIRQHT